MAAACCKVSQSLEEPMVRARRGGIGEISKFRESRNDQVSSFANVRRLKPSLSLSSHPVYPAISCVISH
jgi:hypothetical protein